MERVRRGGIWTRGRDLGWGWVSYNDYLTGGDYEVFFLRRNKIMDNETKFYSQFVF